MTHSPSAAARPAPRHAPWHYAAPLCVLLLISLSGAQAAPFSPAAKAEVNALLDRLERSGCQFNRNGSWHSSQEARAHLARKFEAVESKSPARTAEGFIELAGSTSSSTGQPYQVRCGNQAAVPSASWLTAQLTALRQQAPAPGAKP